MSIVNRIKYAIRGFKLGWNDDLERETDGQILASEFVEHIQGINKRIDAIERSKNSSWRVDGEDVEKLSKEERLERAIENVSKTSLPSDYFTNRKYPGLAEIESRNLIQRYTVENRRITIRFQSGQELIISAPNEEILSQLRITAENLGTDLKPHHATADGAKVSADLNDLSS